MLKTPKFLSSAQTSLLSSRLWYPASNLTFISKESYNEHIQLNSWCFPYFYISSLISINLVSVNINIHPFISTGSASKDSINLGSKMEKNSRKLMPKQLLYSYIVYFNSEHYKQSRDNLKYTEGCVQVIYKYYATFCKVLEHLGLWYLQRLLKAIPHGYTKGWLYWLLNQKSWDHSGDFSLPYMYLCTNVHTSSSRSLQNCIDSTKCVLNLPSMLCFHSHPIPCSESPTCCDSLWQ